MSAITLNEFGGPENLTESTVQRPEPGPGEVLIEVAAAALNRADLMQRQGHYPPPPGASDILGLEVSGRIAALGPQVDNWSVGDEVCALLSGGGYAEFAVAPTTQLFHVPETVGLVDSAALPEVACTVVSNLDMTAHLQPGELALLHGGSSGIGTFGIQFARARGAIVATTARTADKLTLCAGLGATVLIDYTDDDFVQRVQEKGGADVILDMVGAKYLSRNVDALAPDGRLVVIGLQGGATAEIDLGKLLRIRGTLAATNLRGRPTTGPHSKADVVARTTELAWPLIESRQIAPVVGTTFPMSEAAAAHEYLAGGDAVGKILLVR
ncbi:NAD(P)H-quinone oxidoreductase [Williamsia sterculiae]|uniref:Putative NAD(P)H quinone oxidoreductase, PIG3 family n=1 Tax=Williamsia sterculiae TaxID=1344003 RepID=A0A1N7HBH0_9NOCA|nr:NAD(P)H-quinone oxidoreductase [Williamsia sterculiae]SIS22172.1 putative NAD(P)H quinone oxidoreductase, PIG3 family [Williamsia sterculiae]